MAYNHQKEELKWRKKKEIEEAILRKHGISDEKINELYKYDRKDFNRERRYKEKEYIMQDNYFIQQPIYDKMIIVSVEDLLNLIDDNTLFLKLKCLIQFYLKFFIKIFRI